MKRRDCAISPFSLDEAVKAVYNEDNNISAKEVKYMNKTDFIAELAKKTGLSTEDGAKVNGLSAKSPQSLASVRSRRRISWKRRRKS